MTENEYLFFGQKSYDTSQPKPKQKYYRFLAGKEKAHLNNDNSHV